MLKKVLFLSISMLFFSQAAHAVSSTITAKVVFAGTYGNGDLYVQTDTVIDEPGCAFTHGNTRFSLNASHSQVKNWLSIALTALSSGKSVKFRTNGCYDGQPTFDQTGTETFFYITD